MFQVMVRDRVWCVCDSHSDACAVRDLLVQRGLGFVWIQAVG